MRFKIINTLLSICFLNTIVSCNQQEEIKETTKEIIVKTNASHPCIATGEIEIVLPIHAFYTYKLNNLPYQTNPYFRNLKTGRYSIYVLNTKGEEIAKEITIDTIANGNQFKEVAAILKNNCKSCHSGINPQAGLNFTNVCTILEYWENIRERAIYGNPTVMPPNGILSQEQRNTIISWINNGHSIEK